MIQLKVINEDNFLDAFQLRLADGQEKYVSNPIRSLAQAYVYRKQCQAFGDSNRAMVVKQEKCYTSKARGCSTAIVFTRYILIEWLRRKKNDQKTGRTYMILRRKLTGECMKARNAITVTAA